MRNVRQIPSSAAAKRRPRGGQSFDATEFLAHSGIGKDVIALEADEKMFRQGENSEHVFYVQKGRIKLSVISNKAKRRRWAWRVLVILSERTASFRRILSDSFPRQRSHPASCFGSKSTSWCE